jgi:hypothetical protein
MGKIGEVVQEMRVKLKDYEYLKFALEVDYKRKKGYPVMTLDELRTERKYKNDMQFEIILPNGQVERKYITQKRLKEIDNIRFKVMRELI